MKYILILLFSIAVLFAQNKQQIINSGDYFYGTGASFDAREARDQALSELTEQIAVRVSKSFEHKIEESAKGLDDGVRSILRTHSAATLKNVRSIKHPLPDGRIEVFCYLSKNEVSKVFNERKKLIAEMACKAGESEETGNFANALKLYYFSMLLLNSLPDQNVIYNSVNYTVILPAEINRIIAGLRFELLEDKRISDKEREITVKMRYNDRPVSTLDFTFWDGSNQVSVSGRDGLAAFQLFGGSAKFKKLQLNIKYAYYNARKEYNVVAELWPVVNKPVFKATKILDLSKKTKPVAVHNVNKQTAGNWNIKLKYEGDFKSVHKATQSTTQFLNILQKGDKNLVRSAYRNDPFLRDKILNYMDYNHPKVLYKTINAQINKTKSGYELRKIRVLNNYASMNKQSTEYLVLDFSDKGNLIDINTAITKGLYEEFVKQSEFAGDWQRRQQIIKFIEKYRTAYLTRDIQTVDLMFAEDALILIGRKIKRKKLPDNAVQYQKMGAEPDYEYLKLTKENYLKRQRAVFKSQKDIFLDFGSFDIIKKNNSKNVYGVEMRQNYSSTTYSDEGYLFLLIDFSDRDPLIYVRAWQPNEWDDSTLVRTANFRIYK